jgi:hypothetical protein
MYPSSLSKQSTLLDACWEEDEDPSPQHRTNGVQCQQSQQDRIAKQCSCWLVGLLARQLVGSSAKRSTLLNACWEEDEDPSPQHGMNGIRCQQSLQDRGAKQSACRLVILSALLACWFVGSSARRLISLSAHEEMSLDYYILQQTGESLANFFYLFFFQLRDRFNDGLLAHQFVG